MAEQKESCPEGQMAACSVEFAYIKKELTEARTEIKDVRLEIQKVGQIFQNGLSRRVAVNETQTRIQWWFIGGIFLAIIGLILHTALKH